jgi:hypothetical protein
VQSEASEGVRSGKAGAHAARPAGHAVPQSLFYIVKVRWRAHRIKPPADIDPGFGFPTEVTSSRYAGRSGIPFEHW